MTEPLISIIVPVYNLENYIEKTLESIFHQTYTNIEVIAVDDGSKDGTPTILDGFSEKEKRLKVIHKENGGVNKARLTGIEAAAGEYIGFVDGDDLIDCDMYERLYNNAVKYGADISHCGYRVVRLDGTVKYRYNTGNTKEQNNVCGITDLLEGEIIEPGLCNKLYRRKLFDDILSGKTLFDSSLVINEDLLMNYFLFKKSQKSIYEDFCPYCYVKRENSASQREDRLIDYEHPIRVRQIICKDSVGSEYEKEARIIYISKTLHKISQIYDKDYTGFANLKSEMVEIVRNNHDVIKCLSTRQKINAYFILKAPFLYKTINKLYKFLG